MRNHVQCYMTHFNHEVPSELDNTGRGNNILTYDESIQGAKKLGIFDTKYTIWHQSPLTSPWRKSRSCRAQFLRKFRLFAPNGNFSQILPSRAIFAQICDIAKRNFSQSSQILQFARNLCEDMYVFPLKFAFSVLGWRAINFCANWAPYSYQRNIHLTHNTTDSMCFMQTLLILQRTRLYYGYRTVFLK